MIASLLTGCASAGPGAAAPMASAVTLDDAWAGAADTGMTAVFGTLTNTGSREARLVGGRSPAAATVEVHEVAAGANGIPTMRPKAGGITVPAGGAHDLEPGGDHLMLMDLTGPLKPGADVSVTVTFEDGSTLAVVAQVRDFAGGNEEYSPGAHGHG
nr:copper chaperone PCu(A)C [Mycolicibacterium iranicum]